MVEEAEEAVVSVLVLVSVVVEVLETVLTHEERVMVVKEDKLHIKDLDQVVVLLLLVKEMLVMVLMLV